MGGKRGRFLTDPPAVRIERGRELGWRAETLNM